MLKKIYFGDKPLFLSGEKTEELKPYIDDKHTVVIESIEQEELKAVIGEMQQAKTAAGVILHKMPEAFEAIKKEFTLIQASGGLVYSDDTILLIFRRGKWDLPKGKLDEGEELVPCALREVQEETGLDGITFEQTLSISYHTYYEGGKHILKETHWHLMKGNDQELLTPQTEEDIEKCEWVKIDNLASYMENAPASIIDVVTQGIKIINEKKALL